jgi:hypothetical protein
MNLKKLGIVLFLLIAVAGFSLSSVSAIPAPYDEVNFHLGIAKGDQHQISYTAPEGYTEIKTYNLPSSLKFDSSVKDGILTYTFTAAKVTGEDGFFVDLYNPKTKDTKKIRYLFDVRDNSNDFKIWLDSNGWQVVYFDIFIVDENGNVEWTTEQDVAAGDGHTITVPLTSKKKTLHIDSVTEHIMYHSNVDVDFTNYNGDFIKCYTEYGGTKMTVSYRGEQRTINEGSRYIWN